MSSWEQIYLHKHCKYCNPGRMFREVQTYVWKIKHFLQHSIFTVCTTNEASPFGRQEVHSLPCICRDFVRVSFFSFFGPHTTWLGGEPSCLFEQQKSDVWLYAIRMTCFLGDLKGTLVRVAVCEIRSDPKKQPENYPKVSSSNFWHLLGAGFGPICLLSLPKIISKGLKQQTEIFAIFATWLSDIPEWSPWPYFFTRSRREWTRTYGK